MSSISEDVLFLLIVLIMDPSFFSSNGFLTSELRLNIYFLRAVYMEEVYISRQDHLHKLTNFHGVCDSLFVAKATITFTIL